MIKKYKIDGMHCSSCAINIEWDLEDAGVEKCKCSYAKSELEIDFDENKITEKKIIDIITQAGYQIK